MTSTNFERFVKSKKALLAECVQECGWLHEDAPDMPSVDGADIVFKCSGGSLDSPHQLYLVSPICDNPVSQQYIQNITRLVVFKKPHK